MIDVQRIGLAVFAAAALTGCTSGTPFMLDNLCSGDVAFPEQQPRCRLGGDAAFVSGLTPNTLAVRFGPGGGSLALALDAIPAVQESTWSLEVLGVSNRPEGSSLGRDEIDWGSCGVACPENVVGVEVDLPEDVSWARVVDAARGTSFAQPTGAVIVFRGTDLDIIDLRTPGFDQNAERF